LDFVYDLCNDLLIKIGIILFWSEKRFFMNKFSKLFSAIAISGLVLAGCSSSAASSDTSADAEVSEEAAENTAVINESGEVELVSMSTSEVEVTSMESGKKNGRLVIDLTGKNVSDAALKQISLEISVKDSNGSIINTRKATYNPVVEAGEEFSVSITITDASVIRYATSVEVTNISAVQA
jgi:PBP1b-binding outer membrane lipoprotein LpoB